jgi:hypothetical protein
MKKVVFFNYFHNGDIHASRGLVRQIIDKVNQMDPSISFSHAHRNSSNLLEDISNLTFESHLLGQSGNEHSNLHRVGDTVFFNTWYAQQNFKYMNRYGVTFDSLYAAFDDSCKNLWNFSLQDISDNPSLFLPTIDYSKFQVEQTKNWLANNCGKKIFISNGQALSGQAHNFPMSPLISELALKHSDKIFILSNQEVAVNLPNVFQSKDIIGKIGCDLNENAFISEQCDVIIGRASGTFSFALTQNNLLQRNCTFLCFSNLVPPPNGKFWLSDLLKDKIQYTANIIVDDQNDTNIVKEIIEKYL